MRIAIIYDAVYPYIKGGGEKRYWELARRLSLEHEVHLISWQYWKGPALAKRSGVWFHGLGSPRPLYGRDGRRSITEALLFAVSLFRAMNLAKFDIIDCCIFPYFHAYVAKVLSAIRGERMILTWHEYWGNYWRDYLGPMGSLAMPIERVAAQLPDAHIAVSEFTARRLRSLGGCRAPISVIPNGVDFAAVDGVSPAQPRCDIIFVGRLIAAKRVDRLLEAVATLASAFPTLRCSIVGEGPEAPRLRAMARSMGIEEHVTFQGAVADDKAVYMLMKGAKVLVLPSEREGFGISVLEANACGLPAVVVESPHNAALELVKKGVTGLVASPCPPAIAEVIGTLLANESYRRDMADSAYAFSRAFDWTNLAQQVSDFYEVVAYDGSN